MIQNNIWNTISRWVWSSRQRQQWRTFDRNKFCSSTNTPKWGREKGDKTNGIEQTRSNYEIPVIVYGKIGSCIGFDKAGACG